MVKVKVSFLENITLEEKEEVYEDVTKMWMIDGETTIIADSYTYKFMENPIVFDFIEEETDG